MKLPDSEQEALFSENSRNHFWTQMILCASTQGWDEVRTLLQYLSWNSQVFSKWLVGLWVDAWVSSGGPLKAGLYNFMVNGLLQGQDQLLHLRIERLVVDQAASTQSLLRIMDDYYGHEHQHARGVYYTIKLIHLLAARGPEPFKEYLLNEDNAHRWSWAVPWLEDELLRYPNLDAQFQSNEMVAGNFLVRTTSFDNMVQQIRAVSFGAP